MKDVIELAREVKATAYTNRHYPDRTTYTFGPEQLKAFESLVRADEREACAKVCDELIAPALYNDADKSMWDVTCMDCAAAIRNRGQA